MDAIAAEAGVGKGTLFRRFGDRAGLALALLHEQTAALQEQIIRGPAPLGPGAPPKERLKAMARAQLALLEQHGDLMAAGEAGRPGARFDTAPYAFLRTHAGVLIREADPDADWEILADILLAPLATDAFFYWCTIRQHDVERIAAAFDRLVDRLLP
jgi:AcrR family transcriptional regulator